MTRARFYDARMHGLDWKRVGDRYRAQAVAAIDKRAFQIVINQMLGELKASHLAYFTDDDLEFYLLQSLFSPAPAVPRQKTERAAVQMRRRAGEIDRPDLVMEHIGVTGTEEFVQAAMTAKETALNGANPATNYRETNDRATNDVAANDVAAKNAATKNARFDKFVVGAARRVFVVRAILDGSPAARVGLRVGDRLLSAGGRPFSTVGAWRGRAGKATPLLLERAGVGRMTLVVTPVAQGPQTAFLEATRRSVRIIPYGGKKLGYIHLWCMTHPAFQGVLEDALTRRFAQTDGLILDLRDGFGGTPFGWSDVLFRPAIEFRIKSRVPGSPPDNAAPKGAAKADSPSSSTPAAGDNSRIERGVSITRTGYDKPLVLLINRGTRSSKEYFAYQIKKSARGTLAGTTTAGAFLAAGGWKIDDEGFLELPIMQLALDNNPIEGRGVAPDIFVEANDAYSPHDTLVARAAQVLLEKLR